MSEGRGLWRWFAWREGALLAIVLSACAAPGSGGDASFGVWSFEVSRSMVSAGEQVTLSWSAASSDGTCVLQTNVPSGPPAEEDVACEATRTVVVTESTSFQLVARLGDRQSFATASVPVQVQGDAVEVSVVPGEATLEAGARRDFTAIVTGTDRTEVSWTADAGSVQGTGATITYVAPETEGVFELRAVSSAEPASVGVATIRVGEGASSPAPEYTLSLNVDGPGTVGLSPGGASCDASCDVTFGEGTEVSLVPEPDGGATFEAFGGDATCDDGHIVMTTDRACTATFRADEAPPTSMMAVAAHVDQHVLTWAGPDTPLAPTMSDMAAQYRSTLHVEVRNDGTEPRYDVAVAAHLPAELGVATESLSSGGSYDGASHTLGWHEAPGLDTLRAGQTWSTTVDVYARQKPGACWDEDAASSYTVPPVGGTTDGGTCQSPYDDPYVVTIGGHAAAVSGTASTAENGGNDVDFTYSPSGDEADVWTVQPSVHMAQEPITAQKIVAGDTAGYDIVVRHQDQVRTEVDPENTRLAPLEALYPYEFGGTMGAGTGHWASSSVVRDNPYLTDLHVETRFGVGLDFTHATDFDGSSISFTDARFDLANRSVSFRKVPHLAAGSRTTARVALTGNLESDDGEGNARNGASHQLPDGTHAWSTEATISSPQLTLAVSDALSTSESFAVVPPPEGPFLTVTTNGEVGKDPTDDGSLVASDSIDPVPLGQRYWYMLTAANAGDAMAEDVELSATLSSPVAELVATAYLYEGAAGDWDRVASEPVLDPASVTFAPRNLGASSTGDPNQWRVILEAKGEQSGSVDLTLSLDYENPPATQAVPLQVVEGTSIEPE